MDNTQQEEKKGFSFLGYTNFEQFSEEMHIPKPGDGFYEQIDERNKKCAKDGEAKNQNPCSDS